MHEPAVPAPNGQPISRASLSRPAPIVAPQLLGCVLSRQTEAGIVAIQLTEVEAYNGVDDPGSHAYRGRTPRNEVMFGIPGHLYVYFTYGMHWCANLVCGEVGVASAVLLRAGVVVSGIALARERRPSARHDRELARGPARLANSLGLTGAENGVDVCAGAAGMTLERGEAGAHESVVTGPRVGLARAADRPWRFWLDGHPTVSLYRPHVPKRRGADTSRDGDATAEATDT